MSDSCGHARRLLWPDAGLRAADEATVAARRHSGACRDCRAFFADMAAVRDAVRASLSDDAMPTELRERIYGRLAEARSARARSGWRKGVTAAAIAAVLVVGALLLLPSRSPVAPLVSILAAEHAKAVGGDRLISADRSEIERWLSARVPFAVHVPEFSGGSLSGARICLTEDGRGAVVEYAVGDRPLSYFVLPSSSEPPPMRVGLTRAAESGYRMVLWRDAGLVHALVGALSEDQLDRFARECIVQAMRLASCGTLRHFTSS
ncbi:MAG: hypothetical protein ABR527_07980 [Gemmatimonadota bacterium]